MQTFYFAFALISGIFYNQNSIPSMVRLETWLKTVNFSNTEHRTTLFPNYQLSSHMRVSSFLQPHSQLLLQDTGVSHHELGKDQTNTRLHIPDYRHTRQEVQPWSCLFTKAHAGQSRNWGVNLVYSEECWNCRSLNQQRCFLWGFI